MKIRRFPLCGLLSLASASLPAAPGPLIQGNDRVAIVGDSITEQKAYSRWMEVYMMACQPQLHLSVMQFGWSGEKAPRFAGKMQTDLLPWRPTLATFYYGMNDGFYKAYEEKTGEIYHEGMDRILQQLAPSQVRVLVGSPGVVDSTTFQRLSPAVYNDTLKTLGEIAREQAEAHGARFADVHGIMAEVMTRAKTKYGPQYHIAGQDGIHLWENGHLLIAYAFLKEMGFDGTLASIEMDMSGKGSVSPGHEILEQAPGRLKIRSSRYPLCFSGDPANERSSTGLLAFLPIQQDLNRFILKVKGLSAPRAKVVWGKQTQIFETAALQAGINLAAEFRQNPFSVPFANVARQVGSKQGWETAMIKSTITGLKLVREPAKTDARLQEAVRTISARLLRIQSEKVEAVRASVVPVEHAIRVEPVL